MNYLLTMKVIKDGKPKKQELWNAHDTLTFIRKVFIKAGSDESSADIQALGFLNRVDAGKPQIMENEKNGHVVIVQLAPE